MVVKLCNPRTLERQAQLHHLSLHLHRSLEAHMSLLPLSSVANHPFISLSCSSIFLLSHTSHTQSAVLPETPTTLPGFNTDSLGHLKHENRRP
jgi:hypothetical protein